jgi:hypothetical protein
VTGGRAYKRSWKNLLINKRYQLRFTLFMAGLSAVLMTLLGWWVTQVAGEATTVAKSRQRGRICPQVPEEEKAPTAARAPVKVDIGEMKMEPEPTPPEPGAGSGSAPGPDDGAGAGAGTGSGTGSGADGDDEPRHRVVMGESSMRIDPNTAPPPVPTRPSITPEQRAKLIAERDACEKDIQRRIAKIGAANRNITYVLVGSGVLLTLGLAVFGIKMTHKVAGPLHKVTLYLAKMRDGRYDKVYDLRKGDQLVEFYEHFKHAHAGVVTMEQDDIARIKAALDALETDGVLARSDDARAAAEALRKVLERKEGSFV